MKTYFSFLKLDIKLALRTIDVVVFCIFFPILVALFIGMVYNGKPAFAGSDYSFIEQSFSAVASIGICATGLMGLPLSLSDYRDKKILRKFQVSPVNPLTILLSHFTLQLLVAIVSSIGVYFIVAVFYGYRMAGNFFTFAGSYLFVVLSIYSIGLLLASLSPNIKTANLLSTIIYFPTLIFSGTTVPLDVMPEIIQKAASVFPMAQGIKLMKSASLGLNPENIIIPVVSLAIIFIICTILSIKYFKWDYA